ncbi:hypothetical protein JTB14_025635 [Gonioctena quinquepunctata]|nr:hypothetical protein JTB14_025635 [Gonioctena quinquepunctata]
MATRRLPELETTYSALAKTNSFAHPAKIQSEFEPQPCTTLVRNSSTQPLDKVPSSPVRTTTEDGFKEIRRTKKTAQVGTGVHSSDDNSGFEVSLNATVKKKLILIMTVKDIVSEEQIGKYLSKKGKYNPTNKKTEYFP